MEAARAELLWGARPPSERDLLVDLIAAEGLPEAVARLRKFWSKAQAELVGTRLLATGDVEVYERLVFEDGRELSSLTLVRMKDGSFRVVSTSDAPEDTMRILVLSDEEAPALDDAAFTRAWAKRYGGTSELVLDANDGALGHLTEDWIARIRGPMAWEPLREKLSTRALKLPAASTALEVALTPGDETDVRMRQLAWLGRAASLVAETTGGTWLYLQQSDKVVGADELGKALGSGEVDGKALATAFIRLMTRDGWAWTRGMSQLALPEVEIELAEWPDAAAARRLVGTVAVSILDGRVPPTPAPKRILSTLGTRVIADVGRRGSEAGKTYGRFGAIALRPAERAGVVAQSGPRIRVNLE